MGSQDGKSDWLVVMPGVGVSGAVIPLGMSVAGGNGEELGDGSHMPAGYLLSLCFSNLL